MLTLISIYRACKHQAVKLSQSVYYDLYANSTLAYCPGLFFYEAWLGSYTEKLIFTNKAWWNFGSTALSELKLPDKAKNLGPFQLYFDARFESS